jgi:hypothetical protein
MTNLPWAIAILIVVLALHLIEEIKTDFRRKFPLGEMPRPVFVGGNVAVYLFSFLTLLLAVYKNHLAVPFAWVFAIAMLLNGIVHIVIMLKRKAYFPGGVTALILIPCSGNLIFSLINPG